MIKIKVVKDLKELRRILNQPPIQTHHLRFNGSFALSGGELPICNYTGDLVLCRNPSFDDWYSIENFVEDRKENSPNFIAEFYKTSKWFHIPAGYDLNTTPIDYITSKTRLINKSSSLIVDATLAILEVEEDITKPFVSTH